jgi:segregation and condensation protein A
MNTLIEQSHKKTHASFSFSVGTFSGPLDVLLDLVEKRKLFINELSLAAVAEGYIQYVQQHETTLMNRAEFIAIAATLILIKSRSLLPDFTLTEEEEGEVNDLQYTLQRYALYRTFSKLVEKNWGKVYLRESRKEPKRVPCFAPSNDLSMVHIHAAFQELLRAHVLYERVEHPKAEVLKTVSLETMIDRIKTRIKNITGHASFRTTAAGSHRGDVVVLFLALLELVKIGIVHADQESHNDDILMKPHHDE